MVLEPYSNSVLQASDDKHVQIGAIIDQTFSNADPQDKVVLAHKMMQWPNVAIRRLLGLLDRERNETARLSILQYLDEFK